MLAQFEGLLQSHVQCRQLSLIPLLLLLCTLGVAPLKLRVFNLKASSLRPNQNSNADGFVRVYCGSASLEQTEVYNDSPNPSWGKSFTYERALQNDLLELKVMDKDVAFDDELGVCQYRIKVGISHPSCSQKKEGILRFSYSLS
uniref:C2 domain-containing protein n=1 Tax=Fundulus heteroclitus TaxID=8078 RepID=A0A3Q2UCX5_FUNHE